MQGRIAVQPPTYPLSANAYAGHGPETTIGRERVANPGDTLGPYVVEGPLARGGMGAVYLAKDRNLGDAPRAVKEMVESHLDPTQHEKAIGDFKRESLLLTSLEHPSIPTIYDYFYDETLSRFYLVMKYISGGDLASRMRAAVGGRLDEKTVADWGMQVADVLDAMAADAGARIATLRVNGGATANDLLLQLQADLLGVPVERPVVAETTAVGAAYLAGLAVGYWSGVDEIAANWALDRRFEPSMREDRRRSLVDGWHDAVDRARSRR